MKHLHPEPHKRENLPGKYVQEPCKGCSLASHCAERHAACEAVLRYNNLKPWKPEQRAHPSRALFALANPDHVKARRATKWNIAHNALSRSRAIAIPVSM